MMIRAFNLWQQTRWPGRNGRLRYAHTLFNLYVVRCLALLAMRLWDSASGSAGERLAEIQRVLDRLWRMRTADQPVLVRDARWLIQMAQSPATEDLAPYFDVAENISAALAPIERIEIHNAGVRLAAGHLRSQIRYYAVKKGVSLDDESVVRVTRNSNALDFALMVQDLVPLLEAYEGASQADDDTKRLELAEAICQGISADPELFVNRVELLGAYSMIEHLFVTTDGAGQAVYTSTGRRHARLLGEYAALIGRLAKPLSGDCPRFRPVSGAYSPYALLYGFASDLLAHMVLNTLMSGAVTRFSVEDVFAGENGDTGKLAWVSSWRKLPHLPREVQQLFDYPQQFAEEIFNRIEGALRRRASESEASGAGTGRLFLLPADPPQRDSNESIVTDLPARYVRSSDRQIAGAQRAEFQEESRLLSERREGKCLVSYKTAGGWVAITKDILTDVLGAGRDVRITGLPPAAAEALKLLCPGLGITIVSADQPSP